MYILVKEQFIYHVKNAKLVVLLLILSVSVGSATYIQFLKGRMFQQAVSGKSSQLLVSFLLFALVMTIEVSFYYVEWQYENKLVSETFFELKKSVLSTVTKFKPYKQASSDANTSAVFWDMLFDWFNQGDRTMIIVSHTIDETNLNRFDKQLDFNALIKS